MGELHNLMGLVAALLICGAPHAVRLIRAAEPSDATIGYWLQRAYFVLQACGRPPLLPLPFSPAPPLLAPCRARRQVLPELALRAD